MSSKYMSPVVARKAKNNPAYMRAVEKAYAYFNQPDRAREIIVKQAGPRSNWSYIDWRVTIDGNNFVPYYDSMTGIIQVWFA